MQNRAIARAEAGRLHHAAQGIPPATRPPQWAFITGVQHAPATCHLPSLAIFLYHRPPYGRCDLPDPAIDFAGLASSRDLGGLFAEPVQHRQENRASAATAFLTWHHPGAAMASASPARHLHAGSSRFASLPWCGTARSRSGSPSRERGIMPRMRKACAAGAHRADGPRWKCRAASVARHRPGRTSALRRSRWDRL